MNLTGEAYEAHFTVGFLVMMLMSCASFSGLMSSAVALLLGPFSILTAAFGWETFGAMFFESAVDPLDIIFSVLGAIIPAVIVAVYHPTVKAPVKKGITFR